MRKGEPLGLCDRSEIHTAAIEQDGGDVTYDRTEEHRDDLYQTLTPDRASDRDCEGDDGKHPVVAGHLHSGTRKRKTDQDDDRANDHWREQFLYQIDSEQLDKQAHQQVNHTDRGETAEHSRHTVKLRRLYDRSYECEAAAEIDRNLASRDKMEE